MGRYIFVYPIVAVGFKNYVYSDTILIMPDYLSPNNPFSEKPKIFPMASFPVLAEIIKSRGLGIQTSYVQAF